MPVTFRTATEADGPAFERARALAFGGSVAPEGPDRLTAGVREHERTLVGVDGDEIVATSLGYTFEISVPGDGRVAPSAGFAGIAVVPTHRRRGILRELMRRNIDDARARGEALSVLWPSESPIYRRFGYGPATTAVSWQIDRDHAELIDGAGDPGQTVRILPPDPAKVAEVVAPVHDALRRRRPGMLARSAAWWERRTASAASSHVWVVAEGPEGPEGYASYAISSSWQSDGPANTLSVAELAATSVEGAVALWRYLFGIDLVRQVSAWGRPPDDPLPRLVANSRRLHRSVTDGAWLRIVDLPSALAARRYRAEVDIVLDVRDEFCPWNAGRWQLSASERAPGECKPSDADPDLSIDVADLAAAYLGDASIRALTSAGLVVEHRPGMAEHADRAFSWSPAPWAVTWF